MTKLRLFFWCSLVLTAINGALVVWLFARALFIPAGVQSFFLVRVFLVALESLERIREAKYDRLFLRDAAEDK